LNSISRREKVTNSRDPVTYYSPKNIQKFTATTCPAAQPAFLPFRVRYIEVYLRKLKRNIGKGHTFDKMELISAADGW
jgi:hypothetical protein